jgi:hypothetical protein
MSVRKLFLSHVGAVLAVTLLLWSPPSHAEAPEAVPMPPSSRALLREMADSLMAARHLRFHVEQQFDEMYPSGQKLQFSGTTDVALRRPNGLYIDYQDDLSAKKLWYDGKSVTLLDVDSGVYVTAAAPGRVEELLDRLENDHGIFLPMGGLLRGKAKRGVVTAAKRGRYIGIHDVRGVPCRHLAFVADEFDFQLWVEDGETPLPRKVVVTYKHLPGSPQYEGVLMDWDLDAEVPESTFEPKLPEGAVAAEFLKVKEAGR